MSFYERGEIQVSNADGALYEIAQINDGVVTAKQAERAGFTRRQLQHRVATGRLVRWRAGVFVAPAVPPTARQQLRCAVLASGGAASHRSAGWLHGLLDHPPERPEISLPSAARFRDERVRVHRQLDWSRSDVAGVDGIATTDLLRTVVDLGTKVSTPRLLALLELGISRGDFTHDDIVRRRQELARRGRDGVGPLRELLEVWSPDLGRIESPLEARLWHIVTEYGLPQPVRQHEVDCAGRRYRLDLAYPQKRIAIEGDGFGVHSRRDVYERDRLRQNDLTLAGWLILRFTWRQCVDTPAAVARTIRDAHRSR